jgi:hypothetical protein
MYDETGICGIQETWFEGGERRKKCQRYSKHGWFIPEQPTYPLNKNTYITEGWSDTTVLVELGYIVVGRFNALHIEIPHRNIKDQFGHWIPSYIISDTDKCGIQGSKKLQRLIPNSKILYPFGYPDIRAKFLKEGVEQTKKWVESNL